MIFSCLPSLTRTLDLEVVVKWAAAEPPVAVGVPQTVEQAVTAAIVGHLANKAGKGVRWVTLAPVDLPTS